MKSVRKIIICLLIAIGIFFLMDCLSPDETNPYQTKESKELNTLMDSDDFLNLDVTQTSMEMEKIATDMYYQINSSDETKQPTIERYNKMKQGLKDDYSKLNSLIKEWQNLPEAQNELIEYQKIVKNILDSNLTYDNFGDTYEYLMYAQDFLSNLYPSLSQLYNK